MTSIVYFDKLLVETTEREQFIVSLQHERFPPSTCPPVTISGETLNQIIDDALFLSEMIFSTTKRLFNNDPLQQAAALGLDADLQAYLKLWNLPELWSQAKWFFRPDFLLTETGVKAVEVNVAPALGGPGICDVHAQAYQERFASVDQRTATLSTEPLGERWLSEILMLAHHKVRSNSESAVFCSIVPDSSFDLNDDFTLPGFKTLMKWHGVNYFYCSADELEFKSDGVRCNGLKIDVVFTDFCYSEFIDSKTNFDVISDLTNAHVNNQVLFLSPPHNTIYDQKSIFTFLTDDSNSGLFNKDEWQRLQRLLPQTKNFDKDTHQLLLNQKNSWIIKPKHNYGGNGITIGKDCDKVTWQQALHSALHSPSDYIAQRFVDQQLPIYDPNLESDRVCCIGPLFNYGVYIGTFYRDIAAQRDKPSIINGASGARYGSIRIDYAKS